MNESKLIDLYELLAAPLVATIDADLKAAQEFANFITKYGFEEVRDESTPDIAVEQAGTNIGRLRMLTFWYTRNNPTTNQEEYVYIRIPVLSLIPLPLLQVAEADYRFNIQMHAAMEPKPRLEGKSGALLRGIDAVEAEEKSEPQPPYQRFKARMSSMMGMKSDELISTMDTNMNVKIQMRRADMPAGIINLMTLFNESTSVSNHRQLEKSSDEVSDTPSNG